MVFLCFRRALVRSESSSSFPICPAAPLLQMVVETSRRSGFGMAGYVGKSFFHGMLNKTLVPMAMRLEPHTLLFSVGE